MSTQGKSFLFSVTLHLLAVALLLVIAVAPDARRKPVVIDLSIERLPESSPPDRSANAPRTAKASSLSRPQRVLQKLPPPRPSPETPAPTQKEAQVVQAPSTENQVPIPATAGSVPASLSGMATRNSASAGTASGYGPGSGGVDQAPAAEKAKKLYLREHFAAIRDSIMKRISYPMVARKRGWAGTVKVSFIVCEDGRVKEVRIVAGSGFDVLDRNAVETVRECSPYPKPPVTAEVIMPITYRLD